ncbi:hypothetical protein TNCV_1862101 [Trichonephila clavipes]|nr:hypothetical protein TNCV_1862101 [Trichonephila clavipes]
MPSCAVMNGCEEASSEERSMEFGAINPPLIPNDIAPILGLRKRRLPIFPVPRTAGGLRTANWSQCSLYPASNQRAASKLSVKPKNFKNFPPRRSTLATPPGFRRQTNRRYATQQKEKPHSRHAPHRRLALIWD